MIIRTRQGDVELRSAGEWGESWKIPQPGDSAVSAAGVAVTTDRAYGIPAMSNVMRSPAEIIGALPFMVYRDKPRRKADNTWQWQLLHEEPDDEGTGTYQFFFDLDHSLEGYQNTVLQKVKSPTRVEALRVMDPNRVRIYRDRETGEKLFDIYNGERGGVYTGGIDEFLHIRGFSPTPGGLCGVSLINIHRDSIGSMLAMQQFEGDYFRNSAQPPFWFTGAKNQEHAQDLIKSHNARHRGSGKQFGAGALWGSVDVKTIPMSMADAQYVDAKNMSVEEACRILRWPKELLELSSAQAGQAPRDENAWVARMLKFYVMPRLKRIERAFAADKDLFGVSNLFGKFLLAEMERADFVTRMRAYKDARQGGWATANDIREWEEMPPHTNGDTLLETPTGSAPNDVGPTPSGGEPSANGRVALEQEMMLS